MRKSLQPMTDTGVHPALLDTGLHDYIHEQAKRHCRRDSHFYEDLKQEAWLYISLCPNDATITVYQNAAYKAIRNAYNARRKNDHYSFEDYFTHMHG